MEAVLENYCAAVYARLSVKGSEKKAQSIKNQIMICRDFIGGHRDIVLKECYCDYGKSGMNFDRPEFKRMYMDIKEGKINCVVVKDLSRFGRNHIDVGEYLQKIFPVLGVRFIAVTDGYDSFYDTYGQKEFSVNLKNLVNELYASDISIKVRFAKEIKRREGNYLGSKPPYGFKIVYQNGVRILEKEEKSYEIVCFIRKLGNEKKSVRDIINVLYDMKINPPAEYLKSGRIVDTDAKKWCESSVRKILHEKELNVFSESSERRIQRVYLNTRGD